MEGVSVTPNSVVGVWEGEGEELTERPTPVTDGELDTERLLETPGEALRESPTVELC